MANSLTLNNITFNSIENVLKTGSKFTIVQRSGSAGTIIDDAADITLSSADFIQEHAVINAVEIDWNGAEIELPDALGGTQIINTTGQLFCRL